MSAFVVNKRHIDAMLTTTLGMARSDGGFRWLAPGDCEETDYQRGEVWGSTAVASVTTRTRYLTHENVNNVGRMLLFENMRSVAHRYNETLELPEYGFSLGRSLTPVELLSAINCLEYQSCEHP